MSSGRAGEGPRASHGSRPARVRKRDGREVPYDKRKIELAVEAALEAVGESDPTFAGEVADVVELALLDRCEEARSGGAAEPARSYVPAIEEIQDLVERALIELGRAAVAKAYILYRDRRARARNALVASERGSAPAASRVRVREAAGTTPWAKGRIVAALMEEAELARDVAEEVAARVERRVLRSGLRTVTSGLVRELVAGELVELGLDAAVLRQAPVGVPRHDLRRLVRDPSSAPWDAGSGLADRQPEALHAARATSERVGGEVLARFASDDVLGPGSADLHRGGDLEIIDLHRPERPLAVALPAELLISGEPGPAAAFHALGAIAELARGVGRAVVLEDPGPLLAPLVRSRDQGRAGLQAFLQSLGAIARASGRAVSLAVDGGRHAGMLRRLALELEPLSADPFAPTLYASGEDLAELADVDDALELLLARGRLVPTFGDDGRRCAGPGCHRLRDERGALVCSGAVALNLPRLARGAGPWREEVFLAGLADLVRCAVEIAAALHAFQSELKSFLPPRLAARPAFALVPVGLREALRVLGDGAIDPDRGARILGLLAEAARRFQPPGAPAIVVTPFFADQARARLAWLDRRERGPHGQRWLFADAELRREGGSAPGGAYSEGYCLAPVRGVLPGEVEAELLKTIAVGALPLARGIVPLDTVDPDAPRPHLAAWRRFHDGFRARRAGADALLFPYPRRTRPEASLAQEPA